MKKLINIIAVSLLVIFTAGGADAAMITQDLSGEITFAAQDNVFGVALGDGLSWTMTYDLKDLDPGYNTIIIGKEADYQLRVTVGSRTFLETEDNMYGSTPWSGPIVMFDDDNNLSGINFLIDDYTNSYRFKSSGDSSFDIYEIIDGFRDGEKLVSGTLSFEPAPVPVPAAFWLLGSGVVGLVGIRPRR